jgi:protein PhnA
MTGAPVTAGLERLLRAAARRRRRWPFPLGTSKSARTGAFGEDGMSVDSGADDYVYDEATGEWISASEAAAKAAAAARVEVRDAAGNLLCDGDSVTLIKDLKVKGAGQTLKRGTVIKSIRLTGDEQEIDCRFEGIKGLVLRAEFVKKS